MRWSRIVLAALTCASVGCSSGATSGDALPATSNVSDTTAAATTVPSTSAPDAVDTTGSVATTAAVPVVDTLAEPVAPETATIDPDGTVSWNSENAIVDPRARRHILERLPDGFVVVDGMESAVDLPTAHSMSGILATGDATDPQVTVTVTTSTASDPPTLDGIDGERLTIGGMPAVRWPLEVTDVVLTFVVDGRRVDLVARTVLEPWLVPIAESVAFDGPMVSVTIPPDSGLSFVGAYSPFATATDGSALINMYLRSQLTTVRYSNGSQRLDLLVTAGRIVDWEKLSPWLDPRVEPIEVAGRTGSIVRIAEPPVVTLEWVVDGLVFQLAGNLPEAEMLALAAGVRPATDDEWAQISQAFAG